VFVAAGAWAPLLRALGAPREPTWLPVPSNLPTAADPAHVAARRRALCPAGEGLVGHFGTFGPSIASLLLPSLSALLAARGDLRVLLVGRGSGAFGEQLRRVARVGPDRVIATGGLDGRGAAEHLAAADLLVQPYPDGVTTRRSSLMAGLALGVPVVTNAGPLTEDLWERSGAVALGDGPGDLAGTSERLLSDPESRRRTGRKGATLYAERFAVEHAVAAIRRAAEGA
jgi:glycosyltransferase involved in cell wall biosynthesis